MNRQEIFDTVLTNLRKQKFRSTDEQNFCMYRGCEGRKCAVGHLISDENYLPAMENNNFLALTERFGANLPMFMIQERDFLQELQRAHDNWMPTPVMFDQPESFNYMTEMWEAKMLKLATKYELNYTPLEA